MDPKQSAQLDPKLQEAYNRVMGTTVTPSSDTAASQSIGITPAAPTPVITLTPVAAPTMPPEVSPIQQPSVTPNLSTPAASEQPFPVAPVVMPHSTETIRVGGNTPTEPTQPQAATTTGVVPNSKKGIPPVILFLGAIVFLIVYSIFWVRFLNVPVPFLNQ